MPFDGVYDPAVVSKAEEAIANKLIKDMRARFQAAASRGGDLDTYYNGPVKLLKKMAKEAFLPYSIFELAQDKLDKKTFELTKLSSLQTLFDFSCGSVGMVFEVLKQAEH